MTKISPRAEISARLKLPGLEVSARAESQPGLKFYHVIASARQKLFTDTII